MRRPRTSRLAAAALTGILAFQTGTPFAYAEGGTITMG